MSSTIDTRYFVAGHQGLVRDNNEDHFGDLATPHGHVYVVCDGMGGHNAGEEASRLAVQVILNYLQSASGESIPAGITQAIQEANAAIFAAAEQQPEFHGMGTTCVVLYCLTGGDIYLGHVGDSRIYRFHEGQLTRVTRDHSYVQYLVSTGEITEAEADTHPAKNQILKALGIDDTVTPEVTSVPLTAVTGDVFLLCSDGLSDMVSDEAIRQVLQTYDTCSQETVEHLISEALNAGGKDNVTVGLLHVVHAPQPTPATPISTVSANEQVAAAPQATADSVPQPAQSSSTKWLIILVLLITAAASIWWFLIRDNGDKKKEATAPARLVITDSLVLPVTLGPNATLKQSLDQTLSITTGNTLLTVGLQPLQLQDSFVADDRYIDHIVTADQVYYSLGNNKIYTRSLTSEAATSVIHTTEKITRLHLMQNGRILATHNDNKAVLISTDNAPSDTLTAQGIDDVFVHPGGKYFLVKSDGLPKVLSLFHMEDGVPAGKVTVAWHNLVPVSTLLFINQVDPKDFVAFLQDGRAYCQVEGKLTDSLINAGQTISVRNQHQFIAYRGDSSTVFTIKDGHFQQTVSFPAVGREVVEDIAATGAFFVSDEKSCTVSLFKEDTRTAKEWRLPEEVCHSRLFAIGTDLYVLTDQVLYQLNKP